MTHEHDASSSRAAALPGSRSSPAGSRSSGGDSDDMESTDDRSPTLAEARGSIRMTIDCGGSRNTDRRLSPIATQCSSQWDCTHTACSTTTASTSTRTTGTNSPHQQGNPVRRGQPPRRPRADDRSGRLGRCDRPSDVHVLPPPRGQHFWSPSHPSAPSAGDGRADPRPAPDRPAVALTMPSSGTLAAGVVPRCPRRRRRLSPPDVGDAGHLRPNGR